MQATARGQIALAEQITRRDLPSELLLINSADAQGDVASALRHYDHALSAYPGIREQLLPILASGLSDPEVRRALQPYAAKPWLRDFVVHAASYDITPRSLLEFYAELAGKVPVVDMQEGTIRMIGWLASNQMSAMLGTLVNRMPGVPPGAFDPLGFDAVTSDSRFKPLAWDLVGGSAIANQGGGNSLSVEVPPENAAVMASRMMFLAPGQYEVRQTINYDEGVPRARLTWLVACLGEVRSLLADEALPFANASNPHVMRITVPQGCGAQTWQLRASADQSQFASVARIDGLGLTRQ